MAPSTPSSVMMGNRSCASFGVSSSISMPKERAVVAERRNSFILSFDEAMRRLPTFFQSMAWPVSASSVS